MQSGPNHPGHDDETGHLMSAEWMEENMPITTRGWEEEDEARADLPEKLTGFWLLSPERQERTIRLFWVSSFSQDLLFYSGAARCRVGLWRIRSALAQAGLPQVGGPESHFARLLLNRAALDGIIRQRAIVVELNPSSFSSHGRAPD